MDCHTDFRNRYCSSREINEERQLYLKGLEAQRFAELVSHIMDRLSEGHYICPLQDRHKMYEGRKRDLGVDSDVNRTRLKDKLLTSKVSVRSSHLGVV